MYFVSVLIIVYYIYISYNRLINLMTNNKGKKNRVIICYSRTLQEICTIAVGAKNAAICRILRRFF